MLCVALSLGDTGSKYMEQTGIKRGNRQLIQVRYRIPKSCENGNLDAENVNTYDTYYNYFLPEVDELSQNAQN